MIVSYTYAKPDHIAFVDFSAPRLRSIWLNSLNYLWYSIFGMCLGIVVLQPLKHGLSYSLGLLPYWGCVLAVLLFAYGRLTRNLWRGWVDGRELSPIRRTLEIDDLFLVESDSERVFRWPWSSVLGIQQTQHHIFIVLPRWDAIVLPRASFDTSTWNNLYSTLMSKWDIARANEGKTEA